MVEVSARRMGSGSLYAGLYEVWRIGSRFVLTPIMLAHIGLAGYGVWTLLFALCAYLTMFNTSFGGAYVKLTAEYDRKGLYGELSSVVSSGMFVVGAVVGAVLAGLWAVRAPVFQVLGVPPELAPPAGTALALVSAGVVLQMSLGGIGWVLSGLQRVDLNSKAHLFGSMVEFGLAVPLLLSGHGLVGLAGANLTGVVGLTIFGWIAARRLRPELSLSPLRVGREGLRRVIALGARFQLLSFVITGMEAGRKAVVSGLSGVEALALFELAEKLVRLGSTGGHAVVAPMLPAFASLHAAEDGSRARGLYRQGTRVLAVVAVLSYGFLAVFAGDAITFWTGRAYPEAAWTLRLLVIAYFFNSASGVATASLRGRGLVGLETSTKLAEAVTFFALCVPAHAMLGYRGLILALLVGSPWPLWLIVRFCRGEGWPAREYLGNAILRPLASALPALSLIALARLVLGAPGAEAGRLLLGLVLGAYGLAFLGLVGGSLLGWFLTAEERAAGLGLLRRRT